MSRTKKSGKKIGKRVGSPVAGKRRKVKKRPTDDQLRKAYAVYLDSGSIQVAASSQGILYHTLFNAIYGLTYTHLGFRSEEFVEEILEDEAGNIVGYAAWDGDHFLE